VPPGLDLKDAVTIITGIVTLSGVIFTMRGAVGKLESGQVEVLRQLGALHKRMDNYGQRISRAETNHAVLEERVCNLKEANESQRFKLRARVEAAAAGETAMFQEGDDG
jgi:hypothetical protein